MKARPVYVYRLDVTYPEGVDADNPPKGWEPHQSDDPEGWPQVFTWPRERHYLSSEGAQNRAALLEEWGCVVSIQRSEPVTWA